MAAGLSEFLNETQLVQVDHFLGIIELNYLLAPLLLESFVFGALCTRNLVAYVIPLMAIPEGVLSVGMLLGAHLLWYATTLH